MATITESGRTQQSRVGHAAPRAGAVAGVPRRAAGHAAAGPGRHGRPGAGADRRAADHRRRAARARADPTSGGCATAVLLAGIAVLVTAFCRVPAQRPALPDDRERAGHPAGPRVPARARPVGAHPERRAARLAGLPGDQRRRHHLHVHAVGRPADDRQLRPAAGGDRADGVLLVAAHAAGLAVLPAAVPAAAHVPAAGLRRRTAPVRERVGDLLGAVSESVVGASTVRAYAHRGAHRPAHRRARSTGTGRPRRGRRRWSR